MNVIRLLLYSILLLIPLGQLGRFSLYPIFSYIPKELTISLLDIVIVILFIALLIVRIQKHTIEFPPLTKPIGIFIIVSAISILISASRFSFEELLVGGLYWMRFVMYTSIYIASYDLVKKQHTQKKVLIVLLFMAGIVTAIFGLIQYLLYPNLRNLMYLGWDPHEYRIFGTYFDSGFIGILLVITFLLGVYLYSTHDKTRLYISAGITVVFGALILTYSRSSYLALVAGSFVYSALRKYPLFALSLTILLVSVVLILPQPSQTAEATKLGRTASVEARINNSQSAIPIVLDNPIMGIGFNMTRYEKRNRNLLPMYEWRDNNAGAGFDNSFIFVLVTTGFIGFAAYIWFWVSVYKISVLKAIQGDRLSSIVLSITTAVLIHALFNNTLFYPWVLAYLWLILGIAHADRFRS